MSDSTQLARRMFGSVLGDVFQRLRATLPLVGGNRLPPWKLGAGRLVRCANACGSADRKE